MMRFLAAALAAAVLSFPAQASPSGDLAKLFNDYWTTELKEDPFAATYAGVNDYNDKVPGVAPADFARQDSEHEAFLKRLDAIELSGVSESERVSAEILRFILKHDIELAKFDGWRIPFLADTGFHSDVDGLVRATPFRTEKDYRDYITRLSGFPAYFDQEIANMRQGLADGFAQPKEIMAGIMPSFEAQVTATPEEHPLYAPFKDLPDSIPAKTQEALRKAGADVLRNDVIPAYARLLDFMKNEYVPKAQDHVGADYLPDGKAYYAALIHYYTNRDDLTADAVHKLGLKEVARIHKEMLAVIKKTAFKGSFADFIQFLRTDPQFYAKTPTEILRYAAWVAKSIDGKLPGYFGKLPRQTYSVEPVPAEIAENYTSARYSGTPPGGDHGGEYWVNTTHLDKRPLYEIPSLTLHEAVPGHHLQIALGYEIDDAPEFRKQFYSHSFGEGWGLYSEKLGEEMGVYQTPYEEFGRLSMEMWRACRLVIDTGLHAEGWTRQQAMDYLASNTALSMKNVQTEVDRYIAWPGQALAYKIGELTILDLRHKAEKALGPKFDIRKFHDAVLDQGSLPLPVLERQIDDYIARTKAQQ
ncbi:MAG TPA: DUF885 domain-containing protein [Parvularculaceae bacterium]|nr:DUF885 domain-containing protein [Parvularculaceae bacterium]